MACVRVCPADAVAVEGTQVRIVDETCTRCGLCLSACPHDAIKASGDVARAIELAQSGRAALILSVECAVFFYPAAPEQVVNACYAAGFRTVHRGIVGDELVAKEYLTLWADEGWGSMIRSTCPVIVETVRTQYPELIPYLAPIATPIAAEARYLKGLHGADTPIVYAGVCLTEGGRDVDAAITFEELADLFRDRGVKVEAQAPYFTRVPEERRRHLSTAGGLPLELLMEETHASRRFRKLRGLGGLEAIARAVAVDRIDVGFVDILPCEGCLDHPLLGPSNELFRRREIVGATEPVRARGPVVEETVARGVRVGEAFLILRNGHRPPAEAVEAVLEEIGLGPRPWDRLRGGGRGGRVRAGGGAERGGRGGGGGRQGGHRRGGDGAGSGLSRGPGDGGHRGGRARAGAGGGARARGRAGGGRPRAVSRQGHGTQPSCPGGCDP